MNIIREDFFHFLWEHLHFSQPALSTTHGRKVEIIHPGYPHTGDGPDYRYAKIRLDGLLFYGDVELHKKSSEWLQHGHHRDSRYEKVILHVVVQDDFHRKNVTASDGTGIPTLELRSALPANLARLWRSFHQPERLPCAGQVSAIPEDYVQSVTTRWDEYYFQYRLNRMLTHYPAHLPLSAGWKRMIRRGIFEGLGYHKNQACMVRLADTLEETNGSIHGKKELQLTVGFLLRKSGLTGHSDAIVTRNEWDFSACRPANQPAARIRQAAEISLLLQKTTPADWLQNPPEKMWKNISTLRETPSPGRQRQLVLLHNVVLPSVYLLGKWTQKQSVCREAEKSWARQHIPLPKKISATLEVTGFPEGDHAFRLATLHHFKYFCKPRRCGECDIMKYLVQA